MIYWTKKRILKKNSFQEISKDFIKNDFELMISIYLFTKKNKFIFSIFNFQKSYLHLLYQRIYYKILIWVQKIFLFTFIRKWLGVATYFCFIFKRINKIRKKTLSVTPCFGKGGLWKTGSGSRVKLLIGKVR